jgi:hypothetical protein
MSFDARLGAGRVSEGGLVQPPAFALEAKHMPVVVKSIEQRRDDDDISQKLPVVHGSVGRDDRAMLFVAAHQDVGQFFAGVGRQHFQEQIVDQEELDALQVVAVFTDGAVLARQIDFVDELMRLAVMHFIAALDGEPGVDLTGAALACPWFTDEQSVLVGINELEGREIKDVTLWQLWVEVPVKVLEVLALRQPRECEAPLDQASFAPIQLVLHEVRAGHLV